MFLCFTVGELLVVYSTGTKTKHFSVRELYCGTVHCPFIHSENVLEYLLAFGSLKAGFTTTILLRSIKIMLFYVFERRYTAKYYAEMFTVSSERSHK